MPRIDPASNTRPDYSWRDGLICLALAAMTLCALWSLVHAEFIKFDDHHYVTENPHVITGLSWQNVKWAFRTGYASNWHPLTWLSHMLDVRLFGLRPAGHHVTNLLLHISNAVLLFLLLRQLTGASWRSAFVAAFFAVHPLHVESVAWVAERKDVLSTLFFLLTLWAYGAYARQDSSRQVLLTYQPRPDASPPNPGPVIVQQKPSADGHWLRALYYNLAVCLFALGLMSKPMLVTVPFLLLLLDWWPLARLQKWLGEPKTLALLLWEKTPFFLLSGISIVVTILAQAGSHSITAGLPAKLRVANAIVSCAKYVAKTFWPVNLAIYYPHPDTRYGLLNTAAGYPASEQWPMLLILPAATLLMVVSCAALVFARQQPWFLTGWFWFLGTLVPVIGLVQVGMQAMADRYAYIPLIGLLFCLVWGPVELLQPRGFGKAVLAGVGTILLIACALLAQRQASYWRNNRTVFEHALKATRHNAVAECNVGEELGEQGKLDLAQEHFRLALNADPRYPLARMDLGISLEVQGKLQPAVEQYRAVVQLRPWNESARLRLADALRTLGRQDDALVQYSEALKLNPAQPVVQYRIGSILASQHKVDEAVPHFQQAVRLKPNYTEALSDLGTLLAGQGKLIEAQASLRQASFLCPTNATLHLELGKALMLAGKTAEAEPEFAAAVRLAPEFPRQIIAEGRLLSKQGQFNAAVVRFKTALWLNPDSPDALSELAWVLATHPQAQLRNGPLALRLAQRALQLTAGQDARCWESLDAAYTENKRFPEAISAAGKARALALSAGDTSAVQACDARLALYRNQQPFHQ